MTQTVLILGASGKIGRHTAAAFAQAGWTVRRFDRHTQDMTTAAMGADVIVNGMNPAGYKDWDTIIPAITAKLIAAARASGATVIIPGNVYNFGNITGAITPDTPQVPNTRKGRIRVTMEQAFRDANVPTIVLRAGNFIDPDSDDDFMTLVHLRDLKRGRIMTLGDPDATQAYAFVPDWARAAVALAQKRDSLPRFADIPFAGYAMTARDMRDRIAALTGRDLAIAAFPWWLFTLMAPFWAMAREMREMRYLYSMSHHIDGAAFDRVLPDFTPTPVDQALTQSLARHIDPDKAVRTGQKPVVP